MNYNQLIQLYFDRSNALQWYWTLYVVVIGGLLAVSNMRQRRDLLTVCLVTAQYSCFAYKNLGAICEVSLERGAILDAIHQYDGDDATWHVSAAGRKLVEPTLIQPGIGGIRIFHAGCDVLTLLLIWAMELRRVKQAKEVDPQI